MDINERILEMNRIYAEDQKGEVVENIEDLLLTFMVKFQLYEPCKYVSEDDEWVNFIILPPDDSLGSQIMALRKSEIVSFGICNEKNLVDFDMKPKVESDGLYQ